MVVISVIGTAILGFVIRAALAIQCRIISGVPSALGLRWTVRA